MLFARDLNSFWIFAVFLTPPDTLLQLNSFGIILFKKQKFIQSPLLSTSVGLQFTTLHALADTVSTEIEAMTKNVKINNIGLSDILSAMVLLRNISTSGNIITSEMM